MIQSRLMIGINELLVLPFDALKDPDVLVAVIREVGLAPNPQRSYGPDDLYGRDSDGLLQIPREFAQLLVLLSDYPIGTVLDIGTFNGWSTALLTAYLFRWNPCLRVISIDPEQWCPESDQRELARLLPITFVRATSANYHGHRFDFCFIDADHDYSAVRADYFHVGQYARIVAFHDINDYELSPERHLDGGVPRFWHELKQCPREWATFREIIHCSPGRAYMGIGVRIRS